MFTFLAGSFAHREKAGELMAALESRGFSSRIDQGKLNNKTFFKVYAVKEGNRAELEGELFAAGVTEPRLVEERPLDHAAAAGKGGAATATRAAPPKPSGTIAPPIVEPAPPLPDGYVPPPPRASGS
ncbi:SPOR domain-containing protein [Solidesulfovibrio sp.]